ncbi:hypothetical protein Cgig2_008596 [Carnegiea gigantea]|uniref:Uncharacterized protein n=1 Tax=Carnegiea gigantea TaxID=171969 RepID=A0A9Q1JVD6_9CARY|nr:hypothetical protein Cgig2_008596 [Carnegiea gigantea]
MTPLPFRSNPNPTKIAAVSATPLLVAANWRSLVGVVCSCWWLEVVGVVGGVVGSVLWWAAVLLLVESSALFCGGVVSSVVGGVVGFVLWWAALFCGGQCSAWWLLGGQPVDCHVDVILSDGAISKASVLLMRLLQEKYVQKLSETQATQSTQATFDGSTLSTPSEPFYDEQMAIWIDVNGSTMQGRFCRLGPEGDIYTNCQGPCSVQNRVLDDVQAKLALDQAKSKKQTKKIHKYAKATQDMQAQMFQWHSLMKSILPNLPPPIPVIDSLSESEDGGEDENDDGGGGGADE